MTTTKDKEWYEKIYHPNAELMDIPIKYICRGTYISIVFSKWFLYNCNNRNKVRFFATQKVIKILHPNTQKLLN